MRAKTISRFNFERGRDPKDSMTIGKTYLDKKYVEETNWFITYSPEDYEIIEVIRNYRGFPILILRPLPILSYYAGDFIDNSNYYIGTSLNSTGCGGLGGKTSEKALDLIKDEIDEYIDGGNSLDESIHFERRVDPKKSMRIGEASKYVIVHGDRGYGRYEVKLLKKVQDISVTGSHREILYQGEIIDKNNTEGFSKVTRPGIKVYIIKYDNPKDEYWGEIDPFVTDEEVMDVANESHNFERGLDPKKAMGIGNPHIRIIDKVQRFLDKYAPECRESEVVEEDKPWIDFDVVKKWVLPNGIWIIIEYKKGMYNEDEYWITYKDKQGNSDSDIAERFLRYTDWIEMLRKK